jgi:hypothetical protein
VFADLPLADGTFQAFPAVLGHWYLHPPTFTILVGQGCPNTTRKDIVFTRLHSLHAVMLFLFGNPRLGVRLCVVFQPLWSLGGRENEGMGQYLPRKGGLASLL